MNERLREFWSALGRAGRIGVAAGTALVLVAAILAAIWTLREDYQPLFTELDPRDAAAIVGELERMKVPYKVAEDGQTILVDKSTVHATRLKIMGKGVDLKGTVGFEIFNNTDFGMTEFAQRINYQRALQGELARTIMALEEVKTARVHLVLPESGLLRRSTVKPKASVTLALRNERPLQPAQIQGIQRLVAAAVPELDAAAVTVLDQQGVALSRRADGEGEGELAGGRLEAKKEIESYLTRKVAAVLDKAFGPGQGIVSVDVSLSLDQVKTTREDVMPAEPRGGAVTRRRDSTQSTPALAPLAGVVQSVGDAPRGPSASSSEVEYAYGRKVEQIVSSPGGIRRISVGILLPAHIEPREAEDLKQVIAMAVGLDAARGDGIAFSWAGRGAGALVPAPRKENGGLDLRSDGSLAKPPVGAPAMPSWWLALAAAILLLAALAGYRVTRSRREPAAQAPPLSAAEKEELLTRVKRWLAAAPPPGAETRPESRS